MTEMTEDVDARQRLFLSLTVLVWVVIGAFIIAGVALVISLAGSGGRSGVSPPVPASPTKTYCFEGGVGQPCG